MPYNYITSTGVIVPDTSTLKTDVQGEYTGQFGAALLLADDTPQGRLIDVEVTARDLVIRGAAELSNQFNPNINSGIFLKSVAALHAVEASAASYTVIPGVVVTALPSTVIPAGSRIADTAGNYFKAITRITVPVEGTVTADFQATEPGPAVPALNSATQIIDGVFGWLTVNNPLVATPGSFEETDDVLRLARNSKLSLLSKGPIEAIFSNLLAAPNVRWCSVRENDSDTAQTIDGVVMTPSSTWICVQGGADDDIALAFIRSKQTGSPLTVGTDNGTPVLYSVVDPISGQTYPVMFTRPVPVPFLLRVTVASGSAVDPYTAIPDAVVTYGNGLLAGELGFVVGATVSPFEVAAAINVQLPELFIKRVELALPGGTPIYTTNELSIALWEVATTTTGTISVVVV
jgi:hypothetical protein